VNAWTKLRFKLIPGGYGNAPEKEARCVEDLAAALRKFLNPCVPSSRLALPRTECGLFKILVILR
jgi:hypothetical protein